MTTVMQEIGPLFTRDAGHKVILAFGTSNQVAKRVNDGEAIDIVVITSEAIEQLTRDGRIVDGSRVAVARSFVGVAVRAGARHPDIGTPEALKRTLLAVKSVTFSDPATGAASGVHAANVFERLGIAAEMKPKAKLWDGFVGPLVARGEAELAIQRISALKAVPGIEIVGPLPPDLQYTTHLSAAVAANSKASEAAEKFIQFLVTPQAAAVIRSKGLDPG